MTALAIIGPVVFDMITNPQSIDSFRKSHYVGHEVINAAPVYESTGDEESRIVIEGVIYPSALGTTGALAALEGIRRSKMPVPFILGNGRIYGWVLVDRISRKDSMLDAGGTGRKVEFSVDLIRAGQPVGLGIARQIIGIFL